LYNQLVFSLQESALRCIPSIAENSLKFWWSQELNELKATSCATHSDWLRAGRPGSGRIYEAKRLAKAAYKKCIKNNQKEEKVQVSNNLHDALTCKSQSVFWKIWKNKFGNKTVLSSVVEGFTDSQSIANGFASYFADVCKTEPVDCFRTQLFEKRLSAYRSTITSKDMQVDVEILDIIVRGLKKGKAAGVDSLVAEHIQFCHPAIISILVILFKLMIKFEHVPAAFGLGITIPIPKNDLKSNFDKYSDYRGITISPVISKIFELCILNNIKEFFVTSDLQFGFKAGIGCNHAIYTVRTIIDHYTANNSTVNLCALDLTKAFDKVPYVPLFAKLMDRNMPRNIIVLLLRWYQNSFTMVKWNNCISITVRLSAGVRQGGVLSPYLFATFVDDVLLKLKGSSLGCRFHNVFFNAIMYADDILLLSLTLRDLQKMVDLCVREFEAIGLSINISKSACIRIGPKHNLTVASISVNGTNIEWKSELRYLGVNFCKSPKVKCNLQSVRHKYFRSLNGIFGKIGTHSSTAVTLSLINSFCVPVLTYALEAFNVSQSMYRTLEAAYSAAFSKIFATYDNQTIRQCQFFCGSLPLCDIIDNKRVVFLHKFKKSHNFSIALLYEITAKAELTRLLAKHSSSFEQISYFKNKLWHNFENSQPD
jgi:Reverse transcriptase (RNA-dependent DNA polymerase)